MSKEITNYWLSDENNHDCLISYIDEKLNVIKQGTWKAFLIAHSPVIMKNAIGESNDENILPRVVLVNVHNSKTITNFLNVMYSNEWSTIPDLSNSECMCLLELCLQYEMSFIKQKLVESIMWRLHNREVYEDDLALCHSLSLRNFFDEQCIKDRFCEIIKYNFKDFIESYYFVNMKNETVELFLTLDRTNVDEILLWDNLTHRSIKRTDCRDGLILREDMFTFIKHIRFLTMSLEQIRKYVAPSKILTDSELNAIVKTLKGGPLPPHQHISKITHNRNTLGKIQEISFAFCVEDARHFSGVIDSKPFDFVGKAWNLRITQNGDNFSAHLLCSSRMNNNWPINVTGSFAVINIYKNQKHVQFSAQFNNEMDISNILNNGFWTDILTPSEGYLFCESVCFWIHIFKE